MDGWIDLCVQTTKLGFLAENSEICERSAVCLWLIFSGFRVRRAFGNCRKYPPSVGHGICTYINSFLKKTFIYLLIFSEIPSSSLSSFILLLSFVFILFLSFVFFHSSSFFFFHSSSFVFFHSSSFILLSPFFFFHSSFSILLSFFFLHSSFILLCLLSVSGLKTSDLTQPIPSERERAREWELKNIDRVSGLGLKSLGCGSETISCFARLVYEVTWNKLGSSWSEHKSISVCVLSLRTGTCQRFFCNCHLGIMQRGLVSA